MSLMKIVLTTKAHIYLVLTICQALSALYFTNFFTRSYLLILTNVSGIGIWCFLDHPEFTSSPHSKKFPSKSVYPQLQVEAGAQVPDLRKANQSITFALKTGADSQIEA